MHTHLTELAVLSAGRGLCQPAAVANANPTFPQRALLCESLDAVESFFLAGPVKKKQNLPSSKRNPGFLWKNTEESAKSRRATRHFGNNNPSPIA